MMPALKADPRIEQYSGKDARLPYMSARDLSQARPWRTIDFTGRELADFINAASLDVALQAMNADTSHAGGVRICFQESATYNNLIEALNIVKLNDQEKYFLDIRHQPFTLYSITDEHSYSVPSRLSYYDGGCVRGSGKEVNSPFANPAFSGFLLKQTNMLWQKPWQPFLAFFAVISCLSLYRLARPRPSLR
jgi:hypothetical protein